MTDKRYYVTLLFAFMVLALALGTIVELIK
jgi:hypothetical protein